MEFNGKNGNFKFGPFSVKQINIMAKIINKKVLKETMLAYADCNTDLPYEKGMLKRNLKFKASQAVPRDEAAAILEKAIEGGYNEFEARLVSLLPDCMVTIARENSVCLYVHVKEPIIDLEGLRATICANEADFEGRDLNIFGYRFWWD